MPYHILIAKHIEEQLDIDPIVALNYHSKERLLSSWELAQKELASQGVTLSTNIDFRQASRSDIINILVWAYVIQDGLFYLSSFHIPTSFKIEIGTINPGKYDCEAKYDHSKNILRFNSTLKLVKQLRRDGRRADGSLGRSIARHVHYGTLIHEIGHVQHIHKVGMAQASKYLNIKSERDLIENGFSPNILKMASKLSDYASQNLGEFVAEIFTLLFLKNLLSDLPNIPPDLLKIYYQIGGFPIVKKEDGFYKPPIE